MNVKTLHLSSRMLKQSERFYFELEEVVYCRGASTFYFFHLIIFPPFKAGVCLTWLLSLKSSTSTNEWSLRSLWYSHVLEILQSLLRRENVQQPDDLQNKSPVRAFKADATVPLKGSAVRKARLLVGLLHHIWIRTRMLEFKDKAGDQKTLFMTLDGTRTVSLGATGSERLVWYSRSQYFMKQAERLRPFWSCS